VNLASVMAQIATQLDTIAGLRVFAWSAGKIVPPAAIVGWPEEVTFDATYGRGMDTLTLPVFVVAGRPTDRQTVALLGKYADGSGAASVKAVIEAGSAYTAFEAVRVVSVEFDVYTIGAVDYMGAVFMLDVGGSGT
jgi:hypothetical protein